MRRSTQSMRITNMPVTIGAARPHLNSVFASPPHDKTPGETQRAGRLRFVSICAALICPIPIRSLRTEWSQSANDWGGRRLVSWHAHMKNPDDAGAFQFNQETGWRPYRVRRPPAWSLAATLSHFVRPGWASLDCTAGFWGLAMKQSGLREPMSLWVWLALGLIVLAMLAYVTGYFVIEDILRIFSR
jgi:hypothetical protein